MTALADPPVVPKAWLREWANYINYFALTEARPRAWFKSDIQNLQHLAAKQPEKWQAFIARQAAKQILGDL